MLEYPIVSETSTKLKLFTTDMGYARVPIKVKTKKEENKKAKKETDSREENSTSVALNNDLPGELNERRWAVVTFETCAANNLTYDEAAEKLQKLEAKKISGLCIITDDAAQRIADKSAK